MRRRMRWIFGGLLVIVGGYAAFTLYSWTRTNSPLYIGRWFTDRANRPPLMTEREAPCTDAPFLLPSNGFIGLLYADPAGPYNLINRHTGVDIFGNGRPGEIPIVAVYDGELTRLPSWRSTVIIRHDDPLQPGRTIWTYYTHMADVTGTNSFVHPDFPPGTYDVPVRQGQIIGFQGDFGGNRRVGLHLHFSITTSNEDGTFKNESVLANTLDPSPYLGMNVRASDAPARPINCG
ncbi:MAG: M23 family metallopeptidase [Chloroflexota bacterium]